MRHSLILATSLAVAACALLWGNHPAAAEDLLVNGNFERSDGQGGVASWGVYPRLQTDQARGVRQVQPGYRSAHCACLTETLSPGNVGLFSPPASVDKLPGEEVLFTCYYRTDGDPHARLSLVGYSQPFLEKEWKTPYVQSESQILPATPNWSPVCWRFRFLPGVREIVVIFRATDVGKLYVDEASLRPYPTEVTCNVISAGQVESLPQRRLVEVELKNQDAQERNLEVTALAVAEKRPAVYAGIKVRLAGGQTQEVRFNYNFDYRLAHQLRLTVLNSDAPVIYDQRDFQVPGLISAELVSPAFRHALLDTLPTPELAVAGVLNVVPALRPQLHVSAKLVGIGGADFSSVTPPADPSRFRLELPTPALLTGDDLVRVTATVAGSRDSEQIDLPLRRVTPGRPEVGYDEQRRLWVEGKRMFPLGLYGITDPEDLTAVAAAGFNFVVVPWTRASTDLREAAVSAHLGVVVSGTSNSEDFWNHLQGKWGNSPASRGWLPYSRPDLRSYAPSEVSALYDRIAHLSPTLPVLEPLASPSLAQYFASAADILVAWSLPVPNSPLRALGEMVQALRKCGGNKPVWAIIQAQGGGAFRDEPLGPAASGRAPTPAEMQALAYLALVRGADGLMWYSYNPPDEDTPDPLPRANPALWAAMIALNQNLRWLAPVLLDGTRTALPSAAGGAVELARWHYRQADYLIAVNTSENGVVTTLSLGAPHAGGQVMFEDRTVQADGDGDIQESFPPYGVHIYAVVKVT